jgi:hypothetical protein
VKELGVFSSERMKFGAGTNCMFPLTCSGGDRAARNTDRLRHRITKKSRTGCGLGAADLRGDFQDKAPPSLDDSVPEIERKAPALF